VNGDLGTVAIKTGGPGKAGFRLAASTGIMLCLRHIGLWPNCCQDVSA